jgi:hypothetical protein
LCTSDGLHLSMLARDAIAFITLSACVTSVLVMRLCLKWTVSDRQSLLVTLMWQTWTCVL